MNVQESRELLIQSIDDWLEYKKTPAYRKRMKRRAIKGKEITNRLKIRL